LRDADAVCRIELEAVVALDAVCLIGSVRGVYEIYDAYSAVRDLSLTVCKVTTGGCASLLSIGNSQVKATYALVADIIL
jgi:hypothetical protein